MEQQQMIKCSMDLDVDFNNCTEDEAWETFSNFCVFIDNLRMEAIDTIYEELHEKAESDNRLLRACHYGN